MTALVTAISEASTNAALIADAARLGYLPAGDAPVLDMTYGLGRFWTTIRPAGLVAVDLDPERVAAALAAGLDAEVADFTALPMADGTYQAVVFDPPYKLNGTSTARGPSVADADYGVGGTDWSRMRWQDRHALIRAGIAEAVRVTAPGGHVLVKCQDQVCSGKVRWQTREFADALEVEGATRLVDMLHLVGGRPQPAHRRQVHARRNYSTLLIARRSSR